jgi:hypothetical protein
VNNQRSALEIVRTVIVGVQTALGVLGAAIGVVIGWLNNFIKHLTGGQSQSQQMGSALQSVGAILQTVASAISTVILRASALRSTTRPEGGLRASAQLRDSPDPDRGG